MKERTIASKAKWTAYYEKYMMVMGTLGQLIFYIQGIKIFATQSAHDVSIMGFILGLVAVSSWTVYGILIKNKVIFVSNLFAVIGALFAVIGILIYGR